MNWYMGESASGRFDTTDQPIEIIDLCPKILVEYNGANLLAFKDAPGWYVYLYSLLSRVVSTLDGKGIEINSHGYKIIAGPFDTEAQAHQSQIGA